jgi:hypothetical protein
LPNRRVGTFGTLCSSKILDAKGQTVDWGDGIVCNQQPMFQAEIKMFAGHPEYLCAMVKVPAVGLYLGCHPSNGNPV